MAFFVIASTFAWILEPVSAMFHCFRPLLNAWYIGKTFGTDFATFFSADSIRFSVRLTSLLDLALPN